MTRLEAVQQGIKDLEDIIDSYVLGTIDITQFRKRLNGINNSVNRPFVDDVDGEDSILRVGWY